MRRSRNSYIRSPRNVTRQPIGIPARSLNVAMDFFARVTTARWPAIFVSSSAAASASFAFVMASPIPMLRTTFSSLGTAIRFSIPNSFLRTGMTSFLYLSWRRAVLMPSSLARRPERADRRPALLGIPHPLGALRTDSNACRLAALGVDEHEVRKGDRRFALEDAALDVLLRVRARGPLDLVHAFDDGAALRGQHFEDLPARPAILSREDDDDVVLADPALPCKGRLFLLHGQMTSGASEMIFMNFFSRSSLATGPNTRVPIGSFSLLTRTAAFVSNLM